jgi:tetratricopeptide (TPR) repeat protein
MGLYAQKAERKNVRNGNKLYTNEKYTEAEVAYRKSLEVNPRSIEGTYNLGDALYKQQKYPEAAEQYQLIAGQSEKLLQDSPANSQRLANVFHNLGNIGMQNKEYAKSVEAYKQSLRLNPTDDETRYNLALAQKLLEDQQNEDQSQDNQNQDDQQDQEQDQKDDQQQQQQQNDQQENKTQEEQQQNEQMSQDNAQQILDAFLQDEKDTQEKVKKAQAEQQQRRKTDKEW